MPGEVVNCIYCSQPFNPTKGQGDHIIPAALGEFLNDARFRRICPACNNRIGQSEQQLLQCGPERFFRDLVKPVTRRRRACGRSHVGAQGMPPPKFTIKSGDHTEIVEPHEGSPRDGRLPDQLVIRNDKGKDPKFIRLFPKMRPKQLRKRVTDAGIGKFSTVSLHCGETNADKYRDLVQEAWPERRCEELPSTEVGTRPVPGRITFTFDDHYFRAVAKIAFHYYLAHTRRGVHGDERGFAAIRRFIIEGGDIHEFFHPPSRKFAVPFGELPFGRALTPHQWCHVLAANETSDVAVAYVQLFLGPGFLRDPYYVPLGSLNSKVEHPSFVWGHVYLYEQPQPSKGYAGRVEQASVRRLR